MTEPVLVRPSQPVADLAQAVSSGRPVLLGEGPPDSPTVDALLAALGGAGVATASPVPVTGARRPVVYSVHPAGPPTASVPLPCRDWCAVSPAAVASLAVELPDHGSAGAAFAELAEQLTHHGWRHAVVPGVALSWDPTDASGITPAAGWNARAIASLAGPANTALEALISWASAELGGVRVVIDGACMTASPFTGTQHLVLEITRWLARTRPVNQVVLAAPGAALAGLRAELAEEAGVDVVERSAGVVGDVMYRPYQMLFAGELPFVTGTGRRGLVGQLDMIGFSNPGYHPSEQLLFFARNLQRHLMRTLDGVTFISEFGRSSARAELPDLDAERLNVVSCGADPTPTAGELAPGRPIDATTSFLVCLSSTFWHKNRAHAIRTFADLAERHGYLGHLVIVGPEPYFGRSLGAEDVLLAGLPAEVAARVHRWGHVRETEKWWLLRHAQAALYPSVVEGFGIVPFEAAAVGTPCLVASATATGELLGGTPAAVDEWSPTAWADGIAKLISDPTATAALVGAVQAVAAGTTWERSAKLTWAAIDHALASPRRSMHCEDGSPLTSVAGRRARATQLRFTAARVVPAVARRASRLTSRHRGGGQG